MRADARDLALRYLEQLKGNSKADQLREKLERLQTLSKRELKILAAMAEKRQAA